MEFRLVQRIGGKGDAPHQFAQELRGIAIDAEDRIYAAGDSTVKVYSSDGTLLRQWGTGLPGFCVAVDADGRVWVGQWQQVEVFSAQGELVDKWRNPERLGLVTSIGLGPEDIFLADATSRWIHRYNRKGEFVNEIGDQHRKGGFHIPNGVVDFVLDGDGIVHMANPGMHRVERYSADGEKLGHFGRFDGRDPAGFPGCCNPTNLALDGAGRVVVSEKAVARAKLYSPDGELLAVIARDEFDVSAKNMDVAVDSRGRIYVADTVTLEIMVFSAAETEASS